MRTPPRSSRRRFSSSAEYFDLEFDRPLPLVFYSSHYDFQQTNIIPSLISDYTAGFTDLAKGRIAIPFSGSLWEFRHVIRHEMVHAFMLEKLGHVLSEHGQVRDERTRRSGSSKGSPSTCAEPRWRHAEATCSSATR